MAKAEWGKKRICANCGALFYDMMQSEFACPSCGTTFDPEAILRTKRGRPSLEDTKSTSADASASNSDDVDVEEVIFDEDDEVAKNAELRGDGPSVEPSANISVTDDADIVDDIGVVDTDDSDPGVVTIEDVSELDDSDDDITAVITEGDES